MANGKTIRRVMAMDTPGYGRSDPPPEPQPMIELAGTAADALDALGYGANGQGAVDVIGYHTGTFIASELAVIRPDLVRRLVLVPNTHGNLQENSRAAAQLLPDVRVVEMPDLTHGVFDVGVARLAAASREFLDQ